MNLTQQGYYNLIVYESDPEDIQHIFEPDGKNELLEHVEDMEKALDFISDRLLDSRLKGGNTLDREVLFAKALELENIRKQALEENYEPYIDLNVVLE